MENLGFNWRLTIQWEDGHTLTDYYTNKFIIAEGCLAIWKDEVARTIVPIWRVRNIEVEYFEQNESKTS